MLQPSPSASLKKTKELIAWLMGSQLLVLSAAGLKEASSAAVFFSSLLPAGDRKASGVTAPRLIGQPAVEKKEKTSRLT